MTTYEAAVRLIEQLSPADQARLVELLTDRLHQQAQPESEPVGSATPAFWQVPDADTRSETGGPSTSAIDETGARIEIQSMRQRWFGVALTDDDATELATSAALTV